MNPMTRVCAVLGALLALTVGSTVLAQATPAPATTPTPAAPGTPAAPPAVTPAPTAVTPAPAGAAPPATAAPEETPASPMLPPPVLAETAPAPTPLEWSASEEVEVPPAKVGYEKGFFIESGDGNHKLVIGGRVQARYTYESIENGVDKTAFSIHRARLKLDGHTFTKDLTYVFQTDFGQGTASLKDYYGDYRFVPGALHLRVGQWKRPFSRQQITSSGSQELVDRAITDKAFNAGRDIGIAVHNNYEKSPEIEYALGLFNGTGEKTHQSVEVDPMTGEGSVTASSNVPTKLHPALVARVGYNHGELKGYSEADLEGGDFRFGVAASGQFDFDADRNDDSIVRGELDAIAKVQGFSTTGGVYVSSVQSGAGFSDRALGALGFHAQLGYVIAEVFQPAVRAAMVAPDGPTNDELELALSLNYYPFGHSVKWQTDIAAISAEATDATTARLRTQLQLVF